MQVKVDKLPQSQVELEIEVSAEELSHFVEQACSNLGKDLEIKGFDEIYRVCEIGRDRNRPDSTAYVFQGARFFGIGIQNKDILTTHSNTGFKPRLSSMLKE